MNPEATKICLQVCELIRNRALDLVPKKTWELYKSIKVVPTRNGAAVGANKKYGPWVHEGTGIHGPKKKTYEIKPKNKKALKFRTKAGKIVFAKKVIHPGIKGNPFFKKAFKDVKPKAIKLVKMRYGEKIARQFMKNGFTRIR